MVSRSSADTKIINQWLIMHNIINYSLNEDLSVNINGDLVISPLVSETIPVVFAKINGNVILSGRFQDLTFLPKRLEGDFQCRVACLTTLRGCPEYVGGNFDCSFNKLISLEGCPKYVGKNFDCAWNNIENLAIMPDYIGGDIIIDNNRRIGSINWSIDSNEIWQEHLRQKSVTEETALDNKYANVGIKSKRKILKC